MGCFFFTVKKHQHDTDDDSGMGPSISTDTKSTTFSKGKLLPPSINLCNVVRAYTVLFLHIGSSGPRSEGNGL